MVQYIKWRDKHHKFIQPKVLVLDEVMRDWDNYDVVSFGTTKRVSDDMYVINEAFVVQHPEIIDPKTRTTFSECTLLQPDAIFTHTTPGGERRGVVL